MTKRRRVSVNTAGFLRARLTGYEPSSILREQLQNADDASFAQSRPGRLEVEFLSDRLIFSNPSLMLDRDWDQLLEAASSDKYEDENSTGEFGVGFWSVLHLTDAPIVTSGRARNVIQPLAHDGFDEEELDEFLEGTRFELPYRLAPTATGRDLDIPPLTPDTIRQLERDFVSQVHDLLLFTRAIDEISIAGHDGVVSTAQRDVRRVTDSVDEVHILGTGVLAQTSRTWLRVRTEIPDPPTRRHGRIDVVMSADSGGLRSGRVFCTFPTETSTGLPFSINAAFQPTEDRRAIASEGERGSWNLRLFQEAGRAVGTNLPTIMDWTATHEQVDDTLVRFVAAPDQPDVVKDRGKHFLDAVDVLAQQTPVVPTRSGERVVGRDLVLLDRTMDPILGPHIGHSIPPPSDRRVDEVLIRWGVHAWSSADVALWLKSQVPRHRIARDDLPSHLADDDALHTILMYCSAHEQDLHGLALAPSADGYLHPLGDPDLPRLDDRIVPYASGLTAPRVHGGFKNTIAWRRAPLAGVKWLTAALRTDAPLLEGKRAPQPGYGALAKLTAVAETVELLVGEAFEPTGTPLAIDDDRTIHLFDATTVHGLPPGAGRYASVAVAKRLGLVPLHKTLDEASLVGRFTTAWSVDLLCRLIRAVTDWDPRRDTPQLLAALHALHNERPLGAEEVGEIRRLPIWPELDGRGRPLTELFLIPSHAVPGGSHAPLLDPIVFGDTTPDEAALFVRVQLQVEYLDTTEELVQDCEGLATRTSLSAEEIESLLDQLAGATFSTAQESRLRMATFVPCNDSRLRRPDQVFLTPEPLPPPLSDATATSAVVGDRRIKAFLQKLGAPLLPSGDDVQRAAEHIAGLPTLPADRDPSTRLVDYLVRNPDRHLRDHIEKLAKVAWMLSEPGPSRRRPCDLLDPQLAYAKLLQPVAIGFRSLETELRVMLGMGTTLTAQQLVALGRKAAGERVALQPQYFHAVHISAARPENAAVLKALRDVPVIPVGGGDFARPRELVSGVAAELWGHLRRRVPTEFQDTYVNMWKAWGVRLDEHDVTVDDHLTVLDELADGPLTKEDESLAVARMNSLATLLEAGAVTVHKLRDERCLLTSLGIRTPKETYPRDLPVRHVERLGPHLPIASRDVPQVLVEQLVRHSLRADVTLEPITVDIEDDDKWGPVLHTHRLPVLRYLTSFARDLPDQLVRDWPPVVKRTSGLLINARLGSRPLAEWEQEAFLGWGDGRALELLVVGSADAEGLVEAIRAETGLERGTGSALVRVLEARTVEAADHVLDFEEVPTLSDRAVELAGPADADIDLGLVTDAPGAGAPQDEGTPAAVAPRPRQFSPAAFVEPDPPARKGAPSQSNSTSEDLEEAPVALPARPVTPRGYTDVGAVQRAGVGVEYVTADAGDAPVDESRELGNVPTQFRRVLSWYEVHHGLLPISTAEADRLAGGVPLRRVRLFGEVLRVRKASGGLLQIDTAAQVFADRQVMAGTVMHLLPGQPGEIECEIRPDEHEVTDVWWLEVDEDGKLQRHLQPAITVYWETDGPVYRAERRFEELDALFAEFIESQKSAKQLLIEVFRQHPDGLTAEEAWSAVAMYRMYAISTIRQTLSEQVKAFECDDDGRWFLKEDAVLLQISRPSGNGTYAATQRQVPSQPSPSALALKLADLLATCPPEMRAEVAEILGFGPPPAEAASSIPVDMAPRDLLRWAENGWQANTLNVERFGEALRHVGFSLAVRDPLRDPRGCLRDVAELWACAKRARRHSPASYAAFDVTNHALLGKLASSSVDVSSEVHELRTMLLAMAGAPMTKVLGAANHLAQTLGKERSTAEAAATYQFIVMIADHYGLKGQIVDVARRHPAKAIPRNSHARYLSMLDDALKKR